MSDTFKHVKNLAEGIGPRPATSEREREASRYIEKELEEYGLSVSVERFDSVRMYAYALIALLTLSILSSYILYLGSPFLAFIFSLLSSYLFYREITARPLLSRFLPHGQSQNVTAASSSGEEEEHIVVVAHYDTARWGFMFNPKVVGGFKTSFKIMSAGIFSLPILSILGMLGGTRVFGILGLIPALILCIVIITLFHQAVMSHPVIGANDNASGVAVMLSLAQEVAKSPLKKTRVTFVATGGEEAGLTGMQDFLHIHGPALKGALFINIDNVGGGRIRYTTREGMMRPLRSDIKLVDLASRAQSEHPEWNIAPADFTLMLTDAYPALTQGIKAITIIGLDERGIPLNWHWTTDDLNNIEEDSLEIARSLVKYMIEEIDKS